MYLVDTNVISEARKGKKANPDVQEFFRASKSSDLYLCAQTIGEIRRGLENIRQRGDLLQARRLEKWLDLLVADYADRILSFDEACAQVWRRLMSPHHEHPVDKQIAAIALIHDLTVDNPQRLCFSGNRCGNEKSLRLEELGVGIMNPSARTFFRDSWMITIPTASAPK